MTAASGLAQTFWQLAAARVLVAIGESTLTPSSIAMLGDAFLRAADDMGMLVALSQPHFGHYDWKAADNRYARHADRSSWRCFFLVFSESLR